MTRYAGSTCATVLLLVSTAAVAATPPAEPLAEPPVVEYLSVEANEGGSSGGHAALRIGDAVYHFQHHAPGVLRLHREDASGFFFAYSLLQNRGIAIDRITVSDETYELLRSWFNRRYLTEGMQFDELDALHNDRTLLALLSRRIRNPSSVADRDPENRIALRGAGYFFADGTARLDAAESVALAALRRRVQKAYGADFIAQRSDEVRAELLHLTPAADGFSRRYTDLTTELAALDVLQHAAPLHAGTFHTPANNEFVLRDDERAALAAFAARLEDELVRLLRSPRPDRGFPLLVGMARLVALCESLQTGRLVFLDAFGAEARVVPYSALRERTVMMAELLDDARIELHAARRRLTAGSPLREADFTELESASNRFLELYRSDREGRDVRVQSGPLLPSRNAQRADVIVPRANAAELEDDLIAAEARERGGVQELQRRNGYNLITKNCVSEIFRGINAALAETAAAGDTAARDPRIPAESRARLGGYIEPGAALTFIPFVSARAVRDTYSVAHTQQLPSLRMRRLAEMYRHENPLVVFLRESNTITSTVYTSNQRDSFFLFFTDAVPSRPLLGSLNLVAGVGASLAGLAMLPLDGGQVLLSGVQGALFSLPELAFVSLRKGSFDYVERKYRPITPPAG